MVKKINVVSLSHVKDIESPTENINDEQQLNQIKEEIAKEEKLQTDVAEKPKRKTPVKKTKVKEENSEPVVEPVVEPVIEPVVEPVVEVKAETVNEKPQKKIKTVELVKCDKCNKEMTMRSLRYTHANYCTGKTIIRNEVPVKRQIKPTTVINKVIEITPDVIENHLKKVKENKLKERQEKISKLISKIA